MNYLAHIYLSGKNEDIRIGNFIADFIYGSRYQNYSTNIQKGILLHRAIDTYTDAHPIFRQSKKRLFSEFRHYSSVIVDMFYDHFLAKNFDNYSSEDLTHFATSFYNSLDKRRKELPKKVNQILPVMKQYNWLVSYKNTDDLRDILNQMNHKTKFKTQLDDSVDLLIEHYDSFENEFTQFFREIQNEQPKMLKSLEK
ncbi:acyl carrier protein phosphodiesterase [Psychroflexus sp. MBR-150]|jgi:acyl carrier protein phosphodiesterase